MSCFDSCLGLEWVSISGREAKKVCTVYIDLSTFINTLMFIFQNCVFPPFAFLPFSLRLKLAIILQSDAILDPFRKMKAQRRRMGNGHL